MRRKPPKPTGEIRGRYLDIDAVGNAKIYEAELWKLPSSKTEAEDKVMELTARNLNMDPRWPLCERYIRHASEHGPDFDLTISDQTRSFAELTELAPLNGPYKDAPNWIYARVIVDTLIKLVRKKNTIYSARDYKPIVLIVYSSHSLFTPSYHMMSVLASELQMIGPHTFSQIIFTIFGFRGGSYSCRLWPSSITAPRSYRKLIREQVIVDPAKVTFVTLPNGGEGEQGRVIKFLLPPDVDVEKARRSLRLGVWELPGHQPSNETRQNLTEKA